MEGRKRKRRAHCTACWECHRLHRSCDGAIPCERCIANGKEAQCRPLPRKARARGTRKSPDQIYEEQTLALSIFHQATNQIHPPPIQPQAPSVVPNNQEEDNNSGLLIELMQQLKQVQEMTEALQNDHQHLTHQLKKFKSSNQESLPTTNASEDTSPPLSSSPPSDTVLDGFENQHYPKPTFRQAHFLFKHNPIPSASTTQQELARMTKIIHKYPATVPIYDDTQRLGNSVFVPFAVEDATKVKINAGNNFLLITIISHSMYLGQRFSIGIYSLGITTTSGQIAWTLLILRLLSARY